MGIEHISVHFCLRWKLYRRFVGWQSQIRIRAVIFYSVEDKNQIMWPKPDPYRVQNLILLIMNVKEADKEIQNTRRKWI